MRKIEKQMLAALAAHQDMTNSNTSVINNSNGQFVRLYNTIIFARVNGVNYFSDGGYKTATTASRLRALGANYSYSYKASNKDCNLLSVSEMSNLYVLGRIK